MTFRAQDLLHDLVHDPRGASVGHAVVVMFALLLAACGGDATPAATAPVTTAPGTTAAPTTEQVTTGPPTPTPTTAPSTATPPDAAPIDARIAFVVDALNDPSIATDAAITEAFATSFLSAVSADVIRMTIADATAGSTPPWTVIAVRTDGRAALASLSDAAGTALTLQLEIEPPPSGRIVAATLEPGSVEEIADAFANPGTPIQIDAALEALASRVVYGVFDATDGGCAAVADRGVTTAVPIGSSFKLWVLATLARAIDSGDASWDETVRLDRALRSSPDGEVYQRPDDAEITIRELAELMISISDNTATDLLIARLGRQSIESTMAEIGVSTVERNTPLLSTGDLFRLKIVDPALAERFLALQDRERRRAFLEGEVAATPLPWLDDSSWTPSVPADVPNRIDEIEWFATPADMCLTLHDLDRLAATPGLEPVGEILSLNPGLPFPEGEWSTIRFKGGSEAGVMMFAYWLEAPSGERRVVALSLSDEQRPIGEMESAIAAARLLGHVAETL